MLYTYVPESSLKSVMEHGLHGNRTLMAHPSVFEVVARSKGMSLGELRAQILRVQASYRKNVFEGPNVLFAPIPSEVHLSKNHPLRTGNFVRVEIDHERLMREQPKTKIFGIELQADGVGKTRRRFLHEFEVTSFKRRGDLLWESYADPDEVGYYAPNVPHASVHTEEGHIAPRYLRIPIP